MKNIIAESKSTGLIIQVEDMNDYSFKGYVLVGDIYNKVGSFGYWKTSHFNISKNEPKQDKIEVGTKLVCCHKLDDYLTIGKIYEVIKVDKIKEEFHIINNLGGHQYHDFSDVPNVWFNFYKETKPKQDKIVTQIVEKFKQRSEIGIKKYNTTLEENNTDDFYEHLSEELMDGLLYLQKIKEQKDTYFQLLGRYNELKEQFEKLQAKIKELC